MLLVEVQKSILQKVVQASMLLEPGEKSTLSKLPGGMFLVKEGLHNS